MKPNTLYLPGFSHRLCGRRQTGMAERLASHALKLDGLAALVARFVPASMFEGGGNAEGVRPCFVGLAGNAEGGSKKGVGPLHGYMNQEDTRSNVQHPTLNIQRSIKPPVTG
jgi:hypothetical protein